MNFHNSGVYQITCKTTGRFYVGSAHNLLKRKRTHMSALNNKSHRNQKLQRAWDKYGASDFEFKTLLICSKENVLFYEQILLTNFDPVKNGFNIQPIAGNNSGNNHSEETKAKMKAAWIERRKKPTKPMSEEHKNKIALSKIGKKRKPFTEEARKNMSIAHLGNKNRLGIPHTDETKLKMKITREAKRNQHVN